MRAPGTPPYLVSVRRVVDPRAQLGAPFAQTLAIVFIRDPLVSAAQHYFDIAFVGVVAVDYKLGFMDMGEDESLLRRMLRKHSRQCVMLADSSKFGRQGNFCTYDLRDVDILVTDAPVRADFAQKLDQAQVKVHYAQR